MASLGNDDLNVSGQLTTTPEDDLMVETGCVSSPMTGVMLPGDNSNLLKKRVFRPSGLSKHHLSNKSDFKQPKMLNVEGLNQSAGPLLCPGTSYNP